jgi:triacylglycerol lipase
MYRLDGFLLRVVIIVYQEEDMKRICFITIGLILVTSLLYAGGSASLPTKYPVVLIHGIAMNDINVLGVDYFYGIQNELEDEGYTVFVTTQDCFNSTESRAREVFQQLLSIKAIHPEYTKFNIIAHSQGALDARYLTSNLSTTINGKLVKGSDLVASITSISGVHRGSPIADLVLGILPSGVPRDVVAGVVNIFWKLFFRNETANSEAAVRSLATSYMVNTFNPNVKDVPGIYYQSYAGRIKTITATFLVTAPLNAFIKSVDGANDCMVSVNSAKWGNFRGDITGAWWCGGVDHFMEIGHLFGVTPGFNAPDFYVSIAKDLQNRGY